MTRTNEAYSLGKRILSFVLALVMLVGLVNIAAPTTAQAITEYAAPATDEELNSVRSWFAGNNGAGATTSYAKIIEGELYVWGQNQNYVLGVEGLANNAVLTSPTKIDRKYFGGEDVEVVTMGYGGAAAVTTSGQIYVWGNTGAGFGTTNQYPTPMQMGDAAGKKIISVQVNASVAVVAEDEDHNWYIASRQSASCGSNLQLGVEVTNIQELHRVPQGVYDQMKAVDGKDHVIKKVRNCYYRTYILTEDGKIFAYGGHFYGNNTGHPMGLEITNENKIYCTEIAAISDRTTSPMRGIKIVDIDTEEQSVLAVDVNGDVWAWGANNNTYNHERFGPFADNDTGPDVANGSVEIPRKIYDHNVTQTKAVRAFNGIANAVVLAENNTVWARGGNANGMIVPGNEDNVYTMTQVARSVSETRTIVGIVPNNGNMMFLTKAGDLIFLGDNSLGGAGDGTTDSKPAGETTVVTSPELPPTKPLTKNKVIFEIEVQEGTQTAYYTPETTGTGNTYSKRVGSTTTDGVNLTLDAGRPFKLNVYFEDFGKINTFTMPIRFDQSKLEVVNGAGKAYSNTSELVTPGAIGSSVGIEQGFDIRDWPGGALGIGTRDGTYPKISNADGWVSVMGYSADSNPIIQGKVKMFSISFRAKTTASDVAFDFATSENYIGTSRPVGAGYDAACNGLENFTAFWNIYNASGDGGQSSYYPFVHDPFPIFATRLVTMRALDMSLTYGDNNTDVSNKLASDAEFTPGWEINWGNKSVNYTLTANAYSNESKTAGNVSFPQVTWKYELMAPAGANNLDRELDEFITIFTEEDTYLRFKINPSFTARENETPAVIKFTATGKSYTGVTTSYYVRLRSYEPPKDMQLAQKDSSGALVPLTDGQEIVYHGLPAENTNFYVDMDPDELNREVVWSLLDSDGNAILSSDPDAKVTLDSTGVDATKNVPMAGITPRSTTGDDYVTLHVESLYDASVYDEVKIKVQLYATELGFSPDLVRIPVEKDGVPSSVDLSQYLQVKPVDVYATNYTWAVTGTPTRDPANAPDTFVPGTTVLYGSLGSGSTAAVFNAYDWATPKADADHAEEYVTVTVTDTLSGKSAAIKIAIMDLNSPIAIDDFATTNALGYTNDILTVKKGLLEGDKLRFYRTYEDAVNQTNMYSETTIVAGMFPSFTFTVGNRTDSLMAGEGGFLAVQLIRKPAGAASEIWYDPVPVWYDAEPSLVDGYAHLYGRNSGTIYDQNIRIDLEGLNFKETVYTDANGYFRFTKYIAPGTYSMVVSKKNYLTRRMEGNSAITIQVNEDGEFHISEHTNPILIFPGELTNDNAITVQDITYYVANWVGLYNTNITDYELYNFDDQGSISTKDLELLLMRKDWVSGSYPKWNVPNQ